MNTMNSANISLIDTEAEKHIMPLLHPTPINGVEINTVNARELHAKLGVGKKFTTWLLGRIEKYDFVNEVDYLLTFPKTGIRQNVVVHDYFLTLSMAKELCMVENNEQGKMIRRYFIECEQKALQKRSCQLPEFTNPAIAARAWADEVEKSQKLQLENKQQAQTLIEYKPKADFVDDVFVPSEGSLSLGDFGRILFEDHGLRTGPRLIFSQLRTLEIIHKLKALPYMKYIKSGHFKVKETLKNGCAYATAYLTPKGQLMVHNLLKGDQ